MFPCRLQPEMCFVWKHLCLARRRDAWYALGRQRDSSPAGADVLAPTCVGVFFMASYTGHKKDPISFEAGLAPSCSHAALYPLPCRILLAAETKHFCPVAPAIKKDPISFKAGLAPLELPRGAISASLPHPSGRRDRTILPGCTGHKKAHLIRGGPRPLELSPAALYSLPCRIFSMGETKQFCPIAPAIKDPISFEAGLAPSCSPAALYHLCFHHNRRTDSKKSTLPRQSALRLGCSVLAGWCRIRQPSSPWPALRAPCCPR